MVDPERNVLWACAVDLSFQTASGLRAFDLRTGALEASYAMPDGGVCADIALPQLAGGAFLKINGIAFDGRRTLYTTNYSTGELFAVRIGAGGSAEPAVPILPDTPSTNPDGLRWRGGHLCVAENASGLSRLDPRTGTRTLIDGSLDQPTSLVFVGRDVWITEGQVLLLQAGEPPNLPFKGVRRWLCPRRSLPERAAARGHDADPDLLARDEGPLVA